MPVMVLFLSVSSLIGCSMKDIDKRFFVIAVGIDSTGNEKTPYRVTLKLGIPSSEIEPGITNRFELVTQDGETISQAIRLLKSKVDKEFDFGHAKVFLFGKSLAEKDLSLPMDWIIRRRDIQMIGYMGLGEPTAKEVLRSDPPSERLPGNSLVLSFDKEGTESSFIVTETLADFYRRMKEKGKDPYLPVLQAKDGIIEIDHVAVMDKKRVIGYLSTEETRLLNELVRNFQRFEINTKLEDFKFNIAVNSMNYNYTIERMGKNPPTLHLRVRCTGTVEESTEPLFDKDWVELQKEVGEQSRQRILRLLTRLAELNADPVGFGLRYRASGNVSEEEWQQWQDWYPRLNYDVKVDMHLIGTGVVK